MTTTLELVTPSLRPVVDALWQLYRHDLSEFRGMLPEDDGRFRAGPLPSYLDGPDDPDRCGYLVRHDDAPAGFVLLRGLESEPRVLGEFFVVRAARRQGVGYTAATEVMRRHPGRWEIAFQEENPRAARFWRRVATDLAAEPWTEERRPVPDKPHLPSDTWLFLRI